MPFQAILREIDHLTIAGSVREGGPLLEVLVAIGGPKPV